MKIILSFLVLIMISIPSNADVEKLIFSHYTNVYHSKKSFKTLSELQVSISLDQAYNIQQKRVQNLLLKTPKKGFKVGVSEPAQQKKFNISEPLLGVLVTDTVYNNFSVINKKDFYDLHFETEVGFVLNSDITEPLDSLYILKDKIKEIYTVIEFVDFRFNDRNNLQASDLIISNVLASSYLVGSTLSLAELNNLSVKAHYDSEVVSNYEKNTSSDDHLMMLMWAINTALKEGWKISKNDIFITGALGSMVKAKKGRYIVDYGENHSTMFDIR